MIQAGSLLVALFLAGAADPSHPVITIEMAGTNPCAWNYDGRRFEDAKALVSALPKLSDPKQAHIRISGASTTPYRCIGGLVFEMQVANYGDGEISFESPRASTEALSNR